MVKSQATRSREQNRKLARRLLAEKLEDLEKGDESRTAVMRGEKSKRKKSKEKKAKRKYDPSPFSFVFSHLPFLGFRLCMVPATS